MAPKNQRMKDLKNFAAKFLPTFITESERGCVLLAAALVEGHLEKMLTAKLVKVPEKEDPLLNLYFARKIELAYRLGLISDRFRRDLNLLKDIRNYFAHNVFDCDFENEYIKTKLSELQSSFSFLDIIFKVVMEDSVTAGQDFEGTEAKKKFLLLMVFFLGNLESSAYRAGQPIDPAEPEVIYIEKGDS